MGQYIQLATGILQFTGQQSAANIAKVEGETAAQQEEVAVIQRESDRKSRLADALASQIASAGARGIQAFEGSPLTIMKEDSRKERVATKRDKLAAEVASIGLRAGSSSAQSSMRASGTASLLSAAAQFMETGK